jgi:hypothetical protein
MLLDAEVLRAYNDALETHPDDVADEPTTANEFLDRLLGLLNLTCPACARFVDPE